MEWKFIYSVNDSSGITTILPHHSTVTTCQGSSLLQGIPVSVTSKSARLDPDWLIDDFDRMFWNQSADIWLQTRFLIINHHFPIGSIPYNRCMCVGIVKYWLRCLHCIRTMRHVADTWQSQEVHPRPLTCQKEFLLFYMCHLWALHVDTKRQFYIY